MLGETATPKNLLYLPAYPKSVQYSTSCMHGRLLCGVVQISVSF